MLRRVALRAQASRGARRLDVVPTPGLALVGLVLLNLMWGGSLPATKLALADFGPFTLAAARLVLAAILFLVALQPLAIRGIPARDAMTMAALGVVGFAGVQVLQALGTSQTSGATATVLASTGPLWIAVLRERLRAQAVIGVLLALVGVIAIASPSLDEQGVLAGSPLGDFTVMLSSVAYAVYTVGGKGLAQRYSPMLFCGVSCLGGAAASLPFAFWELATSVPSVPTAVGWVLLAYLSVFVTFVGFIVWFWGLRALPAAQAGALMFLQSLSGLLLAIFILGDRPTPTFLAGCGLVLAGVYLAARRRPEPAAAARGRA
jgi:drug/metabolite transporter (DMT)-like permease